MLEGRKGRPSPALRGRGGRARETSETTWAGFGRQGAGGVWWLVPGLGQCLEVVPQVAVPLAFPLLLALRSPVMPASRR